MMRLPVSILAAHGSLAFPLAAIFLCLQVHVPTFYATNPGMSLTAVGGILLMARLWDAVTDPVIGYFSDRTPGCLGRRRAWIVVGCPVIALATMQLFMPPEGAGAGHLMIWTAVLYLAGTMVIVPMNAWGAELSPDYHQRSRVTGTRAAFGLMGTLGVLSVPAFMSGNSATGLGPTLSTSAIIGSTLLIVAVVWTVLVVPDRARVSMPEAGWRATWNLLRQRSPFRSLLTAFLVNGTANAIPATLFVLYVGHVLERPEAMPLLLLLYFGAAAVSVPFWVAASRRWGKCASWRTAMVAASLSFVWAVFLGPGDLASFIAITLAVGLLAGADLVLPSALQADLIEWDEHRTGHRRAGLFFALWGMATKLSFAFAVGLAFPLLDLAGFDAAGVNREDSVFVLALLYGGLPIALKLAAVAMLRNYAITRDVHDSIRSELALRSAGQVR
ncbi:MAG: MFS transporter [Rhodospirillales bacterium]|nr:MFS transporter [Rhodospirillales bacterium]